MEELLLTELKMLLGLELDSTKDNLLKVMIKRAERDVKLYCNNDFMVNGAYQFPEALYGVLVDLVMVAYNRQGAEGKESESLGDSSITYYSGGEDYPKSLKSKLNRYRIMRVF